MGKGSTIDATIALFMITFLMVSLIGMNMGYIAVAGADIVGAYPVSLMLMGMISSMTPEALNMFHEGNWWVHIVLVFTFLNILPYSKHFHVIMSIPNVFFTRQGPLTKITNMPHITKEVRSMMELDEETAEEEDDEGEMKFGIKDIEDVSWKNFADSLTCTQCGRCTDVCPANTTGKLLSPRKILVDTRRRMNDKGPSLAKDPEFSDDKQLVGDYITPEELWACTTCNACVQECPVNIDHVSIKIDMRRNLVMEAAEAPQSFNEMFTNIENNGAPWSFPQEDRMNWAKEITTNA